MRFKGWIFENSVEVRTIEREKAGYSIQRPFEVTLTAKMEVDEKTMIKVATRGLFARIIPRSHPLAAIVAIQFSDEPLMDILLEEGFDFQLMCGTDEKNYLIKRRRRWPFSLWT